MRVPSWFVLPAGCFRELIEACGLSADINDRLAALSADPGSLRAFSAEMTSLVMRFELTSELRDAIVAARDALGDGRLAVRSSAIGEDGERHSFAGQLETVLGVTGDEALTDAIRRCWASAFTERVLDYRLRSGTLHDASDIAVIVQRQIDGDVSGVMFTVDPVSGAAGRIRISACPGLGDALVSGEVDADEYLLDRNGKVVESRLRANDSAFLDPSALRELARIGTAIESAEQGPRDIEWTIADGEIWVLQSRPITTLRPPTSCDAPVIWDNSNIQESYCGVTTPLTFSFARSAYATVYEQTMRAVGIPEATISEHRPLLRNLLGLIHGRVYYNLNNWYRGLRLLPAFRRNKADMERMMGVDEPVDFVVDEVVDIPARLRRLPRLAYTLTRLGGRFAVLERDTKRFLERFDSTMRGIDRASLGARSLGELMAVLDTLRRECLEQWTTPIVNDFFVMMTVGRLRRLVVRAVKDDVDRVMQTLLGGADVAISAAPALVMLRMADALRGDPSVVEMLRTAPADVALRRAAVASREFADAYAELLSRFGDRCMGELKLESRPMRDDPAFVAGVIRNYLVGATPDPHALSDRARTERERVERGVSESLGMLARWRLRRALAAARRSIRVREEMRLARTRLFGAYRDTYRAIGARLCAAGRLDSVDDILYLTVEEIDAYWSSTGVSTDLRAITRTRRRDFAAFESVDAPNRVVTRGAAIDAGAPSRGPDEDAAILRGLGCSPRQAVGRVRIVTGPSGDLSLAGHVLVATRTDPGWSPLFPSAAAIVVERGSVLSHSAVLARELGLPAVVGIPNLLRTLRDGELVRVDGTAGPVERLCCHPEPSCHPERREGSASPHAVKADPSASPQDDKPPCES
jgi:pyruvate,water dikinase